MFLSIFVIVKSRQILNVVLPPRHSLLIMLAQYLVKLLIPNWFQICVNPLLNHSFGRVFSMNVGWDPPLLQRRARLALDGAADCPKSSKYFISTVDL